MRNRHTHTNLAVLKGFHNSILLGWYRKLVLNYVQLLSNPWMMVTKSMELLMSFKKKSVQEEKSKEQTDIPCDVAMSQIILISSNGNFQEAHSSVKV